MLVINGQDLRQAFSICRFAIVMPKLKNHVPWIIVAESNIEKKSTTRKKWLSVSFIPLPKCNWNQLKASRNDGKMSVGGWCKNQWMRKREKIILNPNTAECYWIDKCTKRYMKEIYFL